MELLQLLGDALGGLRREPDMRDVADGEGGPDCYSFARAAVPRERLPGTSARGAKVELPGRGLRASLMLVDRLVCLEFQRNLEFPSLAK